MKKLIVLFLCFNFVCMPAFCVTKKQNAHIIDDFAQNTLDKNLRVNTPKRSIIVDEFAESNTRKNNITKREADFSESLPNISKSTKYSKKITIVDENEFIPVKIRIKSNFSTKDNADEGDFIEFETLQDVTVKNKTYEKYSTVKARIETISQNKSQGVPADLTIGNFSLDDNPLQGEINKTGANRSLWLYPSMYVGDIFFGLGTFLILIRGGHAKIKPGEVFTVYLKR